MTGNPIKYRVGQSLYDVLVGNNGACELTEWIVRTIRGGKVTAIKKDQFTWVKLSSKNGDWGWAKSIDPLWRQSWSCGQPAPLQTTKRLAWKDCLTIAKRKGHYLDTDEENDRVIRTANQQITKLSNRKPARSRPSLMPGNPAPEVA